MTRAGALALCAFLFLTVVYRAATQSITIDEAYTYTQFVARPLGEAMTSYDANNHVLYTLLARVSTRVFGMSDLTLRLPAIAGAALLLAALWRLPQAGLPPLLLLIVVGANTYVLDLLPLARGYGLALGLFAMGLALAREGKRVTLSGAVLGLAVAANLTFAFPVASLAAAVWWLEGRRTGWRCLAAAGAGAGVLLAWPLAHASRDHFYFGTASPAESLMSLVGASLTHNWNERSGPVPAGALVVAAVLAASAAVGLWRRRDDRTAFLVGVTIAGSAVLLAAANTGAGLPYPFGRTGFYWILLFGAGLLLSLRVQAISVAVTLAAVYFYAAAWSPRFTTDWQFDAGTREIAERLAAIHEKTQAPMRVAASGLLAGSLDYYRVTRGLAWMAPVATGDRLRAAGERFDYYVVIGADREWAVGERGMTVALEHAVAGSVLAMPTR